MIRELTADEWLWITGRGPVAVFSKRMWDPIPRVGELLRIDGGEFVIKGIEQFAIMSMGKDEYYDSPRDGCFLVNDRTDIIWNSICSMHREFNPTCPRCLSGRWESRQRQDVRGSRVR